MTAKNGKEPLENDSDIKDVINSTDSNPFWRCYWHL